VVNPGNLTQERALSQPPAERDRPRRLAGWRVDRHIGGVPGRAPPGPVEGDNGLQEHSTVGHGFGERNEENT
jgi:hypothetical protein